MGIKAVVLVLIIAVAMTGVIYFGINYQADTAYAKEFGTYVTVATQSASLNKTWSNTLTVWEHMNETFTDVSKWDTTYNTIPLFGYFGQDKLTYENTIAAENDYFQGLNDKYLTSLKSLSQSTGFVTEQSLVYEFRNEANSYGGMDWAIHNAYMIQNYPLAYWSWAIYMILWVIAVIIVVAVSAV